MENIEKILGQYSYTFPENLIAQSPANPRDHARLLIYERQTGKRTDDYFFNLARYIPKKSLVIFNQTKVIPARLLLTKETGGKVEILVTSIEKNTVRALANRHLDIGARLSLIKNISFTVIGRQEKEYILRSSIAGITRIRKIIERYGTTPLPPYIKNPAGTPSQIRARYQSIFAARAGSVAAPTASLHFTKRLMKSLAAHEIDTCFITLHVGLGTFATLTPQQLATGQLHEEQFEIPGTSARMIQKAIREKRQIIAVGTTVARTLESVGPGIKKQIRGSTKIFIRGKYKFRVISGLITNFHVPRSSLLMLVASFVGNRKKTLELYRWAVSKKYRLFSFGDGMFIK